MTGEAHRLAWYVAYDDRAAIIWQSSACYPKARRCGAEELEVDFQEIDTCHRLPELDDFTGDLLAWQLDNGWRFPCSNLACNHTVYGDDEDRPPVRRGEQVFCSVACSGQWLCSHLARQQAEALLASFVLETHPSCTLERSWSNPYGVYASLRTPSGTEVTFVVGDPERRATDSLSRLLGDILTALRPDPTWAG